MVSPVVPMQITITIESFDAKRNLIAVKKLAYWEIAVHAAPDLALDRLAVK